MVTYHESMRTKDAIRYAHNGLLEVPAQLLRYYTDALIRYAQRYG